MESSWETGLQAPGLRSTRHTGRYACWWNPQALQSSYPEFSQRVMLVATLKCAKVATWN